MSKKTVAGTGHSVKTFRLLNECYRLRLHRAGGSNRLLTKHKQHYENTVITFLLYFGTWLSTVGYFRLEKNILCCLCFCPSPSPGFMLMFFPALFLRLVWSVKHFGNYVFREHSLTAVILSGLCSGLDSG